MARTIRANEEGSSYVGLRDAELLRLARHGNTRAEGVLTDRYKVIARGLAKKYAPTMPRVSLDDLQAMALLGYAKAFRTYEEGHGANFSTWARPIMGREIVAQYRRETRKLEVPLWAEVHLDGPAQSGRSRDQTNGDVVADTRRQRSAFEDLEARAEANDFLRMLCAEMRTTILAALSGSETGCAGLWRTILRKRGRAFVSRHLAKRIADRIDFGAVMESSGQYALFEGSECAPGRRTVALANRIVPKIVETIFDAFERLDEGETLQDVGESMGLTRRELDQIVRSVRAAALALA